MNNVLRKMSGRHRSSASSLLTYAVLLCVSALAAGNRPCRAQTSSPQQPAKHAAAAGGSKAPVRSVTYDELIAKASTLLNGGQAVQAAAVCREATALRPDRYEAHVLAARALSNQKLYPQALSHLLTALSLAPDETKPEILRAINQVHVAALPADGRRELEALMLVIENADHAGAPAERTKSLHEFMARSATFVDKFPFMSDVWLLRAEVSLELDNPQTGRVAGRKLRELGFADSNDPTVRRVMAQLERKQWLGKRPPD